MALSADRAGRPHAVPGHVGKKSAGQRSAAYLLAAAASAVIAASLIGYFVSPYDAIPLIRSGGSPAAVSPGPDGHFPAPFLGSDRSPQDLLFDRLPLCETAGRSVRRPDAHVAFDPGRRTNACQCNACVRACPVALISERERRPRASIAPNVSTHARSDGGAEPSVAGSHSVFGERGARETGAPSKLIKSP